MTSRYDRVEVPLLELPGGGLSSRASSFGSSLNTVGLPRDALRHDRRKERLNTELLAAALTADIPRLNGLLKAGASPEATCRPTGLSACHVAAHAGHAGVVELLLSRGEKGNKTDRLGRQPAHLAAWAGHAHVLQVLHSFDQTLLFSPVLLDPQDQGLFDMDISDSWSHNHDLLFNMMPMEMTERTTPLHLACMRVHFDCFDYLLSVGARVSVKDSEGLTPLCVAGTFMERGDDDTYKSRLRTLIARLMQKGAKLPKPNFITKGRPLETQSLRVTPLHTGVEMQDLELIEYLLKRGGSLETWNAEGETPVHLAVRKGLIVPLNKMLRWQTPSPVVDVRDRLGRTPLHLAVMGQWSEGVSLLLEVGADVKALTSRNETVLHLAADRGNSTMMEELLSIPESSKVTDYCNKDYLTPLCLAVCKRNLACVRLLCEHGADITCTLPGDYTLLHMAAEMDSAEIIEYLLTDKAIAERLKDAKCHEIKGGLTALHIAADKGFQKCVESLLNANCDVLAKTASEGQSSTALHLAAKNGHLECVETILKFDENKMTLKASDGQKRQPLHLAALHAHHKCVKVMLKYGADISATISDESGSRSALEIITYCVPNPIKFLEEIFDSYIEVNEYPINDPDCEVTVNYDILVPRGESHKQMKVLTSVLNTGRQKLIECLLLHPIAESFIFLKWEKLKIFFFILMGLYIALTLSITGLTFIHYVLKDAPDPLIMFGIVLSKIVLFGSFCLAFAIEIINASQLQRYYIMDFESWVKWTLYVGTCTLGVMSPSNWWARYLAAVTVLLAWTVLLFLMARSPVWGYYVLMFSKVATNLFKVLASFIFLLVGFTFAFMIHFEGASPFSTVWISFVKVIVMLIELDFTDTFTDDEPTPFSVVGRGLFIVFVILVAIVLTNLMVGLAVSDITLLETQGRTQRLAKQIGFFNLLEMFVYNRYLVMCFPGGMRRALERKRRVSSRIRFKPGTSRSDRFHELPRMIRDSILDKVGSGSQLRESPSLGQLDARIAFLESTLTREYPTPNVENILKVIVNDIKDIKIKLEKLSPPD